MKTIEEKNIFFIKHKIWFSKSLFQKVQLEKGGPSYNQASYIRVNTVISLVELSHYLYPAMCCVTVSYSAGVGHISDAHLLEDRLFLLERTVEGKALLSMSFSMHWDSTTSRPDTTEMITSQSTMKTSGKVATSFYCCF